MNQKIQFIISGFYFDKYSNGEYLKSLKYLSDENDNISVFWSCHAEPPQSIKDEGNFILKSHGVGKYGRVLGELFIDGEKKSLNELLKDNGHAYEYHGGKKKEFK